MGPEGPITETAASREPTRRLFFALWPDEAMRQAMAQATRDAARASGGRPVPAHNLHVTLAFLGSVPERRLGALAEAASASALLPPEFASASSAGSLQSAVGGRADFPGGCLELTFDRLEYWGAAQLLCALPAEPPPAVVGLARRLQDQLAARGFAPDLKPFRPHVTVVRKVSRPGRSEAMRPVAWRFAELALVASRTLPDGALYSVVESFRLCGRRKAANVSETS